MTEKEREELIEKMARALYEREYDKDHYPWDKEEYKTPYLEDARAELSVAEPVIREQADNALREENARLLKENSELLFRAHALLWLLPSEITCGELRKARDEMFAATIREGGKDA